MRISGIASGFDTEEMVKQLMQAERIKVDRVEQNKQTIMWRQEQYNSINKQFANFILNTQKDMGLKRTSITGTLTNNSHKNVDYVKKATSSNEMVATVTSTGKGVNGNFEIDVKEIAKDSTYTSAKIEDDILKDSKFLKLNINGKPITVGDGSKSIKMEDVVAAINKAGSEDTSLGTTAFFDSGTKRLFIQSTDKSQKIKLTGVGNSTGDALVATLNGDANENDKSVSIKGKESKILFNGIELEYDSNNISLNGLNIELKTTGITSINVSTNTEGIMEKIEKLVADYNDLVDMASGLVGEKKYSSYKPLSPEEKKSMTEDDVKLWEEKAKSGLLNRDESLDRVLQNMRMSLYKTLGDASGSFNHITQIGISTEKYTQGSAGGKLQIDTDKLRKAIEDDADGVMDLLFKNGNVDDDKGLGSSLSTRGVFTRVYDDLIAGMKSIVDKSGAGNDVNLFRSIGMRVTSDFVTKGSISDLDKSVNEMNRKIDNLNILLAKKEDSHYAKFTAMEKQMYKMNNQSSWLQQQMQF